MELDPLGNFWETVQNAHTSESSYPTGRELGYLFTNSIRHGLRAVWAGGGRGGAALIPGHFWPLRGQIKWS